MVNFNGSAFRQKFQGSREKDQAYVQNKSNNGKETV